MGTPLWSTSYGEYPKHFVAVFYDWMKLEQVFKYRNAKTALHAHNGKQ